MKNKYLVIFDRDGVINSKSRNSEGYVLSVAELELNLRMIAFIVTLQDMGILIAVATNQQCVGKLLISESGLNLIHDQINHAITHCGGKEIKFFVCRHLIGDKCQCRKPKPGLLTAAIDFFHVQRNRVIFVGDALSDEEAARNVSVSFIMHRGDQEKTEQRVLTLIA